MNPDEPIAPIGDADRAIDLWPMPPVYESWRRAAARLDLTSPLTVRRLVDRQLRALTVEAAIADGRLDLDREATEELVGRGFSDEAFAEVGVDEVGARLVRAHEFALRRVRAWAVAGRGVTADAVRELCQLIAHVGDPGQPAPGHLEALVGGLAEGDGQGDDPILVAAWLYHRCTRVFAAEPGAGGLARALLTWQLLRAGLLPIAIDRDLRGDLAAARRRADRGDLSDLVQLFARLERTAMLSALSVRRDAELLSERDPTAAVLGRAALAIDRRILRDVEPLREVDKLGLAMRPQARRVIERALHTMKGEIQSHAGATGVARVRCTYGGTDMSNGHWYRREVIKTSRPAGVYVNFGEAHYFVKAWYTGDKHRLVFVTSFHHVGSELYGIAEVTAFAVLEPGAETGATPEQREYLPCSTAPYVVTSTMDEDAIGPAFDAWLESAVATGIAALRDRLG